MIFVFPRNCTIAVMDDRQLQVYAELAVRVALNVQPGQRLMIIGGSLATGGAPLEAAPLARQIAAAAYRAGSPLVETLYGDERQLSMRFKYAPRHSFDHFSQATWRLARRLNPRCKAETR
jgi:aminopeptidase